MDTNIDLSRDEDAGVVCLKCLLANSPRASFCAECGAPIGIISTIDPFQRTLAEGTAYRAAVDGPPRLIVVVGIWLIMAPVVFFGMSDLVLGLATTRLERVFYLLLSAGALVILFRATKNYFVKRGAKEEVEDEG